MKRNIIFTVFFAAAMLLGSAAVWGERVDSVRVIGEGSFYNIPRLAIESDGALPLFSTRIPVGADYAGYRFAVTIEYPVYSRLTDQEVRLLRRHGTTVADTIAIESVLTVERKVGSLDVSFAPFVRKDGVLMRLTSCKLAVTRTPVSGAVAASRAAVTQASSRATKASSTTTSSRYAAHSVLASGKWVKIRVDAVGVYQLTKSFLSKAGFSDPSRVKLYGYGGLMQDSVITYSGTKPDYDDLQEIPLERTGDKLLFYSEGVTRWRYVRSRWRHVNNPYSSYAYYFLTEGDSPATMETAPTATATDEPRTTIPWHALYERDAYSWYTGGQQFFDSYDFATGNTKAYTLAAPDIVSGEQAAVTVVFSASDASSATTVATELNGSELGTMTIPLLNRSNLGEQGYKARMMERTYTTDNLGATNSVRFTTTSGHAARLDYIRFNYTRLLNMSSPFLEITDPSHSGAGTYSVASATADTKVWRLGIAGRPQQSVSAVLSGSTLTFTLPDVTDSYVAVNTSATFPEPQLVGTIASQDLHGDSAVDMVIIVPASGALTAEAQRLAAAHVAHDSLRVRVVEADKIYNEFSSGTPDAMAYRRYLKMLYDRAATEADMPRFLLLFGDAAWDNRMITTDWQNYSPDDFLLCFESWNSINEISCYVTDDYFCYLDDGEGRTLTSEKPDVAVGRFPVRTAAEARVMVDKTIGYMYNAHVGAWKNKIIVMGDDDVTTNSLMSDAENIASDIEKNHSGYDVRRVYWDSYNVVRTSTGNTYPDITKELKSYMTNGVLLFNYTGHGAPSSISHEKVLLLNDFKTLKSANPSVWVTSSCEITPFDSQEETIGEVSVLNEGGPVAFIGATRSVYSTRNLYLNTYLMRNMLSEQSDGRLMPMGSALTAAKCSLVSSSSMLDFSINKLKYVLTGDPAISLAGPTGQVVIDSINGKSALLSRIDLAAGSVATVVGHVASPSGVRQTTYNGTVTATIYDKLETVTCKDNAGNGQTPFTFSTRTRRLFEGSDSVRDGRFTLQFPVSVDASYSTTTCLMSLYAVSNDRSAENHGANSNFAINTSASLAGDTIGPAMFVYLNNPDFRDGDKTNTTPYFVALLSDSSGINATGSGVGHDIELTIDGDPATSYVLNDYFTNDFGTFTSGSVSYSIPELAPGPHRLYFRAWDMLGNSSSTLLNFTAVRGLAPNILDVSCNPNPATTTAVFNISYDRPLTDMTFTVKVYDSYGQLVWRTTTTGSSDYGHYPVTWNLTNSSGARVCGGVYLYRVSVSEDGGGVTSKTKKLIVINNK